MARYLPLFAFLIYKFNLKSQFSLKMKFFVKKARNAKRLISSIY